MDAAVLGDVATVGGVREVVRVNCGRVGPVRACVNCGELLPSPYYVTLHLATPGAHWIANVCPVHGLEAPQ